ncbi:steryl-sulfatase [Neolamprologus brichardi]|uniref:steryl-sulfatase n=1 Tax=Neolamprologus brichardi TaxID=32507 RepID=UPI001643DB05|nr:steryl-sulfatase [Neolamprologus brichardi]
MCLSVKSDENRLRTLSQIPTQFISQNGVIDGVTCCRSKTCSVIADDVICRTPNIDQLAKEGVKLTHHIAAASLCTPSRAAFLTGRYPVRSGHFCFFFLSAGKWHLGLNCKSRGDHCHHPNNHGFSYFFGIPLTNLRDCQPGHGTVFQFHKHLPYRTMGIVLLTAVVLHYRGVIGRRSILSFMFLLLSVTGVVVAFIMAVPYLNCVLLRDHSIVEQPYKSENMTQRMVHEAVGFIESNDGHDQSLCQGWWTQQIKGLPLLLPGSFNTRCVTVSLSRSVFHTQTEKCFQIITDRSLLCVFSGQLMETLDRLGLRGKTLVYLTSDQGAHLEEISARGDAHGGSNGIYKAGKSTNWEGGIRVPGILRWPGKIPGGRQIDEPTSNMDLFPTVVQLSGASVPEDREIDGHDLMDLLQGRAASSKHEFLFHYCSANLNAVRWHPQNSSSVWKAFYFTPNFYPEDKTACFHTLTCFCTPEYVTFHDPPLLFDLSKDPSESTPLTPDTEPAFHFVLATMQEAVKMHRRSLKPVESQLSPANLMWKPWLQPCCSTVTQLCQCQLYQ